MGKDTTEPIGFWAWTHTEISWTELDTVKLAESKSVPLLQTLCVTGPTVWFPDRVLTLKQTKPSFIGQLIQPIWYYWEERPVNWMLFRPFRLTVALNSSSDRCLVLGSKCRTQLHFHYSWLCWCMKCFSGGQGGLKDKEMKSKQRAISLTIGLNKAFKKNWHICTCIPTY